MPDELPFQTRDHARTRIAPKPRDPGYRYTDAPTVMVGGAVVHTSPAFTQLWEELGCVGFFGFGTGYEVAALQGAQPSPGTPAHCSRCPIAQDCWDRHRERTRRLAPDVAAAFDGIADEHAGDPSAMFAAWSELIGSTTTPDPYTQVMGGNLEDGAHVAISGEPKDRGAFTIPWPFRDDEDGR